MTELTAEQQEASNQKINDYINSLPEYQAIVFAMTSAHLPWGATWGFDTDIAGGEEAAQRAHETSDGKVITFKLRRGTVTEYLNSDELFNGYRHLIKIGGVEVKDSTIEKAKKRRNDALASLHKFLSEGKQGQVGFFNTNQSDTVTIEGVTYPSFCLNARDFLGLADQHGYKVRTVRGTTVQAQAALKKVVGFMGELKKSPSSNAVMVELIK